MRKPWQRVLAVVALAAVAGLSLAALVGGLLTGAIDGPGRGADVVEMATRPMTFWFMAFVYLVLTVVPTVAAYKFARHRKAA